MRFEVAKVVLCGRVPTAFSVRTATKRAPSEDGQLNCLVCPTRRHAYFSNELGTFRQKYLVLTNTDAAAPVIALL